MLTKDGTLYCEYLDQRKPARVERTFDDAGFKASDYSYGGYQTLEEISYDTAKESYLKQQQNWIDNYLSSKGLK